MSKHTPGPWRVHGSEGDLDERRIIKAHNDSSYSTVAVIRAYGGLCEANARLIAAAPELLSALKELHSEHCPRGVPFEIYDVPCDACDAIARAEGR